MKFQHIPDGKPTLFSLSVRGKKRSKKCHFQMARVVSVRKERGRK